MTDHDMASSRLVDAYLGMPADQAIGRVLERARRYVEVETPSGDADAIRILGERVRSDLQSCGADVDTHEAPSLGVNLVARMPGPDAALPPIVVLAHMDTVHPAGTLALRPFRVEDGRAYGPGVYDMKTGIALVVEALAWLRDRGEPRQRRSVTVLVTCDEEIGSHSARALIEEHARGAAVVLVPEPCLPDGGIKTARKGVATYRMETTGRAAHAGLEGEFAVSAITELIHALAAARKLADHSRGTTINIGRIGGGTASNVIAEQAWAELDVRIAEPAEGERVHAGLAALRPRLEDAQLRVSRVENRPPLVRTPAVASAFELARGIAADLGATISEGMSGGGSDGSFANAVGAATLDGIGAQGGGAHAVDEHIVLSDLPFRLALMARLLQTL
ncbi:MAG: M20 family metallopeptidase [Gemmatimonadota bacterium]